MNPSLWQHASTSSAGEAVSMGNFTKCRVAISAAVRGAALWSYGQN